MGSGFGKLPEQQAGAWRCTGPDEPVGFVAADAGTAAAAVALRWTGEVVVVGNQIIGDRRDCWSGYELEHSYGPALSEYER